MPHITAHSRLNRSSTPNCRPLANSLLDRASDYTYIWVHAQGPDEFHAAVERPGAGPQFHRVGGPPQRSHALRRT